MSNKKIYDLEGIYNFQAVCKIALVNYQDVKDGWDMEEGTEFNITRTVYRGTYK